MAGLSLVPIRLLTLLSPLAFAGGFAAQTQTSASDQDIAGIAASLASPIREQHATKVIVAPLRSPEDKQYPAGKWLASQLSQEWGKNFPDLAVVTAPDNPSNLDSVNPNGSNATDSLEQDRNWARSLGANVVVTGVFARKGDRVGISLWAVYSSGLPRVIGQVRNSISTPAQLMQPGSAPDSRAIWAGADGATVPQCIYCPAPRYGKEANKAGLEGFVVLQVRVTADGRPVNIMVLKASGMDLDEEAVKAVRTWNFKPANGPNGLPAAVIVPIEVTFRLGRNK